MSHSPRIAIVSGSFDPITLGHVDILKRAAPLFDTVIVGVLTNAAKQPMFSADERRAMIQAVVAEAGLSNVRVETFDGLVVDFAARHEAAVIIRGVRSATDLDYEAQMAGMNRHLDNSIETVFLPARGAVAHISSGFVRDIIRHGGAIEGLVPASVIDVVQAKRRAAVTRQV